jgi:hypothetical protein
MVGIELTRVIRDPESAFYDRVIHRRELMEAYDALERIHEAILKKESKRRSGPWAQPGSTIPVLQLCDCPLSEMLWLLENRALSSVGERKPWLGPPRFSQ